MPKRLSNRKRRKHLKNLRKIQKTNRSQSTYIRAGASVSSKSNPLVVLGLVVSFAVLLLFLGSMFFQYKGVLPASTEKLKAGANPAIEPAAVEVRVLNGCGVAGASRKISQHLRDFGFDVVTMDNAEHFNHLNTVVINHTNRPELGLAVAEALGCSRVSTQADDLAMADITVILGKDWRKFLSSDQEKADQKKGLREFLGEKARRVKKFLGL